MKLYLCLKRLFDFFLSLLLGLLFFIPILILALLVKCTSKGPALHWSKRVGKNSTLFLMPKFRTMKLETPQVATHLLQDSSQYLTPIGSFLRKTSLDELPQLWSILKGDMSFVGPRPALFNQDDLMALRREKKVDQLVPGLTGWAQINGRDDLPIPIKVQYEAEYAQKMSFFFDLKILFLTFFRVLFQKDISH